MITLKTNEDVPYTHFMYPLFPRMTGESSAGDPSLCSCVVTFFER